MLAVTLIDIFVLLCASFFASFLPSNFAQKPLFILHRLYLISVLAREGSWKLVTQHVDSLWSDLWRVGVRYRMEQLILILKAKIGSLHHLKNGFHIFTWSNCNFRLMGQSLHLILPTDIWIVSVCISCLVNIPFLVVLPNIYNKFHLLSKK